MRNSYIESHAILSSWLKSYKEMFLLFLPILCINIIDVLVMLINTAMSGAFNHESLAAVGLIVATYLASASFCWGVLTAVLIITANRIGEGDSSNKLGLILISGLLLSLLLSLPFMLLFKHIQAVWIFLGQDPKVTIIGQSFFDGAYTLIAADLGKYVILKFLLVLGRLRVAIIANLLVLPLLFVFNTLFVGGYWGLPQLGMYGLGLGTALTYWLVLVGMVVYICLAPHFRVYLFNGHGLISYWKMVVSIIKLGVPIGMMFALESLFFFVIAILMGNISVITLAAYQVAMQYVWVSVMFSASLAETTSILAGRANGEKNRGAVLRVLYTTLCFAFACMLCALLVYLFAPNLLIGSVLSLAEMNNHALIDLATQFLAIAAVYQFFDSGRLIISGALRAMFDSVYPMYAAILSFWVIGLPIGYIIAFALKWEGLGLWYGLIAAAISNALLLYLRLQKDMRLRFA
jgi:MATE family multidrug resistance protein